MKFTNIFYLKSIILFFVFSFLSYTALANNCTNEQCQALQKCFKSSKQYYFKHGSPSDSKRSFDVREYLPAGEPLKGRTAQEVRGIFEIDKLIYIGSGSYHSGYFTDLIIVNADNCGDVQILNIYSE